MPLQCNIDAKGKLVRMIYGVAFTIAGVLVMLLWARPTGSVLAWILGGCATLGGAFAIFESRAGWCVVRAMGFKTPI